MSNEYLTHETTHDNRNPNCQWCLYFDQPAETEERWPADDDINCEPSWINLAELAISMLQDSHDNTVASGKLIIRDMAEKLARVRAEQPNCPEHLKNVDSSLAGIER